MSDLDDLELIADTTRLATGRRDGRGYRPGKAGTANAKVRDLRAHGRERAWFRSKRKVKVTLAGSVSE